MIKLLWNTHKIINSQINKNNTQDATNYEWWGTYHKKNSDKWIFEILENIDYKFIEESEKQLTQWMMKNLSISFFEICEGKRLIRNAEIYIIQELKPILNLTHNSSNPYVSMLKELRAKCKMIAKNKDDK